MQGIFPNCLQTFYKLSLDGSLRGEVMPVEEGGGIVEFVLIRTARRSNERSPRYDCTDVEREALSYGKLTATSETLRPDHRSGPLSASRPRRISKSI